MGRRGYLQTQQTRHDGAVITGYCSAHAAEFLEDRGISLLSHPSECPADCADQWEIEIPVKRRKDGTCFRDFGPILRLAAELRKDPSLVKDDYGDGRDCGDCLAEVLEDGVRVARLRGYRWIVVDWWD